MQPTTEPIKQSIYSFFFMYKKDSAPLQTAPLNRVRNTSSILVNSLQSYGFHMITEISGDPLTKSLFFLRKKKSIETCNQ